MTELLDHTLGMEEAPEELVPPADNFEYQLLVGHRRTNNSFKTTEELQTEYVNLTDKLVYKCTEGVEVGRDPKTDEAILARPDHVIFLDKSARPVAWLFREAWPVLAQQADGSIPKMPDTKFLNIDRLHWLNTVDPEGNGQLDVSLIDPSVIRSLRSIFLSSTEGLHEKKNRGLTDTIDTLPTLFDPVVDEQTGELRPQTVLVVDEVFSTGRTLKIAQDMLARAFPQTQFVGAHWMMKMAVKGQATGNADLPVWYNKDRVYGRGVNDRDTVRSSKSNSVTQKLGGLFLSTIFEHPTGSTHPDLEGRLIRRELHRLVEDLRAHRLRFVPSNERPDDDENDARVLRLNGVSSFDELRKKWPLDKR